MENEEFITMQYPPVRHFTSDVGRIGRDIHYVRSLLEVDISDALQKLKANFLRLC